MSSKSSEQGLEKYTSWFDLIGRPVEEDSYFIWIRGFELISRLDKYFKIIFLPFLLIALILGYIGYFQAGFGNIQSLYMTVRMFLLTNSVLSFYNDFVKYGNYLAFLVKLYILLKVIFAILNELVKSVRIGRSNRHIVICGLSNKGLQLVHDFREDKEKVIVIEKNEKNDLITDAERLGALIMLGDASDEKLLTKARVFSSKYTIIVTSDDSVNISIALATYDASRKYKRKFRKNSGKEIIKTLRLSPNKSLKDKTKCIVHMQNQELVDLLENHEIFTDHNPLFELTLFDMYENIARYLYLQYPPYLLADTISSESHPIHFLIIGFNILSESIIIQNAQIGHYSNEKKNHFTIVESNYRDRQINFFNRYPKLKEICEFNFIDEKVSNLEIVNGLFLFNEKQISITMAIVCEIDDMKSLSTSLSLLNKLKKSETVIFLYLMSDIGLNLFLNKKGANYSQLVPFGMLKTISTKEVVIGEKLNLLAKRIHYDYIESMMNSLTDTSYTDILRSWELLTNGIKDSNKKQADHILVKLHTVGARIQKLTKEKTKKFDFTYEEIELLARIEHNRWMANRYLSGWSFGAERNSAEKITSDLIDYDQLSEEAKNKDRNTVKNIPKYLNSLGLDIVREN